MLILRLRKDSWFFKVTSLSDVHSSPPARAPKLQLAVEQPLKGGSWNHQERYPTAKDKGEAATGW